MVTNMLLKEYIKSNNYGNFYEGKNVNLTEKEIMVGINSAEIETDKKVLFTESLHNCIAILVIGNQVGMLHMDNLDRENKELNKLLQIDNISEIDVFLGPDSDVEKVSAFFSDLKDKITFYASYIDAAYGIDNAEGSIAYNISDGKLYGKNDKGYVEYKKGYINIRKKYDLFVEKNEENHIDNKR